MSIRSDVGIVLHPTAIVAGFLDNLPQQAKELLGEPRLIKDGYHLYILTRLAWGGGDSFFEDAHSLQEALFHLDDSLFKVVEACHDYPDSTNGDCGSLEDDPFNLSKCVRVELEWADVSDEPSAGEGGSPK